MFVAYVTLKFIYSVMHDQVAKWQDVAYMSREMKEGETMSLIDFAKNYNFEKQNEVQKQHWYNFKMTILVHITYMVNPNYNQNDPKSCQLIAKYHTTVLMIRNMIIWCPKMF